MTYSLSLADADEPRPASSRTLPGGCFGAAELSAELAASAELARILGSKGVAAVNLSGLVASPVSRGIVWQSEKIISGFRAHLRNAVAASRLPVDCLIIDFGLEEVLYEPGRFEQLTRFLTGFALDLHMSGCRLALPVRVPNPVAGLEEMCLKLKSATMLPGLCFSLDVHPHEPGGRLEPGEVLRWLKFDMGVLRFIYEPETGNRMTVNAVRPWIHELEKLPFKGQICFCPRRCTEELLLNEVSQLKELLEDLAKR